MGKKEKWLQFIVGLFVVSIGLVLTIKANLGVSPWNVFHIGLTNYFPITIGRANQLTGLGVVLLSFIIARVKPTVGTIINILLIGFFIDLIMRSVPNPSSIIFKYIFLFSGIIIFGAGAGIYISAQCGTGPRDSLMMALNKKLDFKLGTIRNGIEITVLIVGYFLGGPIGIGTVCIALGIGPVVEFSLNLMDELFDNSAREVNSM